MNVDDLSNEAKANLYLHTHVPYIGLQEARKDLLALLNANDKLQRKRCSEKIKKAKRFYLCKPHSGENYIRENVSGKLVRLDDVVYFCLNATGT